MDLHFPIFLFLGTSTETQGIAQDASNCVLMHLG